jgi:hypothetical protein
MVSGDLLLTAYDLQGGGQGIEAGLQEGESSDSLGDATRQPSSSSSSSYRK